MYAYMTIVFVHRPDVVLAKVNWLIEDGVLKTWITDSMGRSAERRYFPLTRIEEIRVAGET